MKFINLTKGFNPYNVDDSECIKFESFIFSGGEPHIKLNLSNINKPTEFTITSRSTNSDEFILLIQTIDALFDCGYAAETHLFIPYFPGARQDRRMVSGEPLTSKIYAQILNEYDVNSVNIFDPHSDVISALLEHVCPMNNHLFVRECLKDIHKSPSAPTPIIISPDAGANKKSIELLKYLNSIKFTRLVKCDKERNIVTGELTGFQVYKENLYGADCVIVDDICDGGGTFIGLAEELKEKNAGDIYLIVSHGIFSKPLKNLKPYFKKIYTTDSWRSEFDWEQKERDCTDLVEITPFKDFM